MLFGVVFIEKNTKKKKKIWSYWKSFTSYLHNRSTLECNSNWFWKLQYKATTFVFWPFLVIGHVTIFPTLHWVDPERCNHPYLVCLHFLVKLGEISFLGYMQRTLKAVPHSVYDVYHPYFFSDLTSIFSLETHKFPFLDIYTGPWQWHPIIVTTIPIFFWFFPYFIAIFHLKTQIFPYLEMHTGPWKY